MSDTLFAWIAAGLLAGASLMILTVCLTWIVWATVRGLNNRPTNALILGGVRLDPDDTVALILAMAVLAIVLVVLR